ncbi:MAG: galactose-1-phosphate uridylyltransferase [Candidatus Aminicenantes bacterium]|nr:galactose-1-phosphate uridylyltransferase [Candidatus Aminicenantes bacterium]
MDSAAEFRRDPISGRWVLIAPERARRPGCFPPRSEPAEAADSPADCPFCPGHEDQTPPEIQAEREAGGGPDRPGWRVRVVPNKYPAVGPEAAPAGGPIEFGERQPGVGAHEVVIETPHHDLELIDLPDEDAAAAWRMIRGRVRALEAEGGHPYVQVFKNRGREAGASRRHPHTQIAALPILPPRLAEEAAMFADWAARHGDCLLCRLLAAEIDDGRRVIHWNRAFAALAPFGSCFPYEVRLVPLAHAGSFADLPDGDLMDLAESLRRVLGLARRLFQNPAYNLVLYQAPMGKPGAGRETPFFHWHLDFLPILVTTAGFEWGTGIHINPVSPEEAAARFRTG